MVQLIARHAAVKSGHDPYDRLDRHAHGGCQVQRAIIGLGLLGLSLLLVTVLAVMQSADKGFWWPLAVWMQR
jgi:hypothetical protein